MEKLYKKLYTLFLSELNDLRIGYAYNKLRMQEMMNILNAIDYIKHRQLSRKEIIKIIKHYE